jgi:hypothetical protein
VEDNEFFLLMKEVDDSNDDNSVRMVGSGWRITNVVVYEIHEIEGIRQYVGCDGMRWP